MLVKLKRKAFEHPGHCRRNASGTHADRRDRAAACADSRQDVRPSTQCSRNVPGSPDSPCGVESPWLLIPDPSWQAAPNYLDWLQHPQSRFGQLASQAQIRRVHRHVSSCPGLDSVGRTGCVS